MVISEYCPSGDTDSLIGIITDRDIVVRAVAEGLGVSTKVKDAISEDVVCVNEDDALEDAAQLMSDYQIRRLPVIDSEGRLIGIVSLGDFAVESSEIRAGYGSPY
jgi:CBS domain-containing protein